MSIINKILELANIRKFVTENMPNGLYFDAMENINLPSEDGEYSDYDAIITVYSREAKEKLTELFRDIDVKVFIAYF
jgi:hypothetical protein